MIVKISSLFKLFLLNATSPAIESTILSTVSWLNLSLEGGASMVHVVRVEEDLILKHW